MLDSQNTYISFKSPGETKIHTKMGLNRCNNVHKEEVRANHTV